MRLEKANGKSPMKTRMANIWVWCLAVASTMTVGGTFDRLALAAVTIADSPAAPAAPSAPASPDATENEREHERDGASRDSGDSAKASLKLPGVKVEFSGHFDDTDIVRVFSDAKVTSGEDVPNVVVVFGDARVDGHVHGRVVVVGGDLTLNGTVDQNVVVVCGSAKFGPHATVDEEAVVVLGELDQAPGAKVRGQTTEVNFVRFAPFLRNIGHWVKNGLLFGRPLPPDNRLAWVVFGLHTLIYLLIALLLPKPVETCAAILRKNGGMAFVAGMVAMVMAGPLWVIVIASGIGLLLTPFLFCAVVGAILLGKTATFQFLGGQLFRLSPESPSRRWLLGTFVGMMLVGLLYMIPIFGLLLWGLLMTMSLGTVVLALLEAFRASRAERASRMPPPRPLSSSAYAGPNPAGTSADGQASPIDAEVVNGEAGPQSSAGRTAGGTYAAPEAMTLPRAGFWIRFSAAFLDFILLIWILHFFNGFGVVMWGAYHVAMWRWKQTTVGGIVCGLKVVRLDGRPIDFATALVRAAASMFSVLPLFLGFFWAGWSAERQSWHDKIAGTTIVKTPRGVTLV